MLRRQEVRDATCESPPGFSELSSVGMLNGDAHWFPKAELHMKFQFGIWIVGGVLLGSILGIAFGKGDPKAPLFVGGVGGLLGMVGFFAAVAGHRLGKVDTSKTNHFAILGAALGAVCGGVIGTLCGLGRMMILIFNPDLPERDVGVFFGAIGGVILGAFFGACFVATFVALCRSLRALNSEPSVDGKAREEDAA